MKDTALVRYTSSTQETRTVIQPRTFAAFMAALQQHQSTQRTDDAQVQWVSAPIVEIVCCGLYLLLKKVADTIQAGALTERKIVESLGPRIEPNIVLGLLLLHKSMENAAQMFMGQVIDPTLRELAQQSGKTQPFALACQKRSAEFFAAAVKHAREWTVQLARRTEQLEATNLRRANMSLTDSNHWRRPNQFRLETFMSYTGRAIDSYEHVIANLLEWADLLPEYEQLQMALARLPFRLQMPEQLDEHTGRSIAEDWVYTQLLLAATDLPAAREYLEYPEYVQALEHAQSLNDDALVALFYERMAARGTRVSATDRGVLAPILQEHIRRLRVRAPATDIGSAYVRVLPEHGLGAAMTQEEALFILRYGFQDDSMYRALAALSEDDRIAWYRDNYLAAVDWKSIGAEQARQLLRDAITLRSVPVAVVLEGMSKMGKKAARAAADRLLLEVEGSKDYAFSDEEYRMFFKFDLLTVTADLFHDLVSHMPVRLRLQCVEKFLPSKNGVWLSHCMKVLAGVPSGDLRAFLRRPKIRRLIVEYLHHDVLMGLRVESREFEGYYLQFMKNAGDEWVQLVLAGRVWSRYVEYGRFAERYIPDPEDRLPPWAEECTAENGYSKEFCELLHIPLANVAKLLQEHPEEECFRWLYQDEPDEQEQIARFLDVRERFFRTNPPFSSRTPR